MLDAQSLAMAAAIVLLVVAAIREILGRVLVKYEYRFDSFSVIGLFGRQLFQIRQSEIESLAPARLGENLGQAKTWRRSQFGRRIVIRARMARRPVVISWEGKPIAGLTPQGMKSPAPRPTAAPKPHRH